MRPRRGPGSTFPIMHYDCHYVDSNNSLRSVFSPCDFNTRHLSLWPALSSVSESFIWTVTEGDVPDVVVGGDDDADQWYCHRLWLSRAHRVRLAPLLPSFSRRYMKNSQRRVNWITATDDHRAGHGQTPLASVIKPITVTIRAATVGPL